MTMHNKILQKIRSHLKFEGTEEQLYHYLSNKFLESGKKNFLEFMEELVSSDIPPASRPENGPGFGHKHGASFDDEDEVENEKV